MPQISDRCTNLCLLANYWPAHSFPGFRWLWYRSSAYLLDQKWLSLIKMLEWYLLINIRYSMRSIMLISAVFMDVYHYRAVWMWFASSDRRLRICLMFFVDFYPMVWVGRHLWRLHKLSLKIELYTMLFLSFYVLCYFLLLLIHTHAKDTTSYATYVLYVLLCDLDWCALKMFALHWTYMSFTQILCDRKCIHKKKSHDDKLEWPVKWIIIHCDVVCIILGEKMHLFFCFVQHIIDE